MSCNFIHPCGACMYSDQKSDMRCYQSTSYTALLNFQSAFLSRSSPRWSSGYPRILLAFILELDSHRCEILKLFAETWKKERKKGPATYWERRAAWVDTKFDASRRGKKMLNSSRDKNEGVSYRRGEGGEGPATWPIPDLRYYYWEGAREQCEDNKWEEEEKKSSWQQKELVCLRGIGTENGCAGCRRVEISWKYQPKAKNTHKNTRAVKELVGY